jgi:hypothetical protein
MPDDRNKRSLTAGEIYYRNRNTTEKFVFIPSFIFLFNPPVDSPHAGRTDERGAFWYASHGLDSQPR